MLTQKLVVRIGMEKEGIESVVPEQGYEYYFNVSRATPTFTAQCATWPSPVEL